MTDSQNPQFSFPAEPDYKGWDRAVDRLVDALDLDFYPSEEAVAQTVATMEESYGRKLDVDNNDDFGIVEDELFALYQ